MAKKSINVWSYLDEYKKEKKGILKEVDKVFSSGQLILGDNVKKLESDFASFCGVRFGVGVNSGTDALFLALKTLGIGAGMEVITVANTAIPTVSAIATVGATPVFVDIDPKTYLIDPTKIEKKITKKTRCILPVHLYGQCADMDRINSIAKAHNLYVLEDCAQSTGARWKGKVAGSMSDIAAFSFYPTKILGAYGDGGMVVTNSKKLANRCRMLRMYGISKNYYSEFLGYNSRLDEVQAAIISFKLKRIRKYIKKREQIAKKYQKELKNTPIRLPGLAAGASHVYYLFVCAHKDRDKIIEYLGNRGINLNVSYKYPAHTMRGFKYLGYKKGDFPQTEKACREIFSIPIFPGLGLNEQNKVISALKSFF